MRMLADGPPPHLPGFLNSLAGPLDHFGYWAVLLFVLIEDFGVPVPGETILIAAAVDAGAGRLNVIAVGVIGFVAAVIGDNIGFAIGHYGGRTLVLRWGRYVRLTEERLDKAEIFFQRHGAWIIIVARFIEVLRQANGIVAGTAGLRWRRFLAFNALGAALWVGTWISLGYLVGNHIDAIYHDITRYSYYLLIALAVVLAAYIARHILRRTRRRTASAGRQAKAAGRDHRRPSRTPAAQALPNVSDVRRSQRTTSVSSTKPPTWASRSPTWAVAAMKPYVGRGGHKGQVSLREVLVHMIEEYARHIGHADLLRERIDGRVGL